jgi:hypothetical protein
VGHTVNYTEVEALTVSGNAASDTFNVISGLLKSADPIKCSIHSRRSIAERALPAGGSTRHSEAWECLLCRLVSQFDCDEAQVPRN